MLDIKLIRNNFEMVADSLEKRNVDRDKINRLKKIDEDHRELLKDSEALKKERNQVSKEIAEKKRNKESVDEVIKSMQ
ncbi:MAG: serine--tRNA ligase, partial [Staphylococcus equorum]|nr:serine--tRNA ligase [Staphylococcus equorum]